MTWLGLRTSYTVKHVLILAFIIGDLALNTVIDSQADKVGVLVLMGVQAVIRIMSLFTMFLFMWNTFVFKYGLLGALCARFKFLVTFFPVSFIFLVVLRVMRAVRQQSGEHSEGERTPQRKRQPQSMLRAGTDRHHRTNRIDH